MPAFFQRRLLPFCILQIPLHCYFLELFLPPPGTCQLGLVVELGRLEAPTPGNDQILRRQLRVDGEGVTPYCGLGMLA